MCGKMSLEKQRSDEFMKLGSDSKKRYLSKIAIIDGVDPYTLWKGVIFLRMLVFCHHWGKDFTRKFALFCVAVVVSHVIKYIFFSLAMVISQFTCCIQQALLH